MGGVSAWVWLVSVAGILACIAFDLFTHVRKAHVPTFKESIGWFIFYVGLAGLFGVLLGFVQGWTYGGQFYAGFLTEKSLSVDNLFVFLLIMTRFAVPREDQQKVLLVGIVIALIFRTALILVGAAILAAFSWMFIVFGAYLLYTALKLVLDARKGDGDPERDTESRMVRVLGKILPTTPQFHGDKLSVRIDGHRVFTPMLIVMVAIGSADVMFALDSIPAVFGLTSEAYIVFMVNAFALMGLRQLYFLLDGMFQRLVYLAQGLAVILAFIGVKLIAEALHNNSLPFIHRGQPIHAVPEISTLASLGVIALVLVVVVVASIMKTRKTRP